MFYAKMGGEWGNILKGSKRHSNFMTKQTFIKWGGVRHNVPENLQY